MKIQACYLVLKIINDFSADSLIVCLLSRMLSGGDSTVSLVFMFL